MKSAPFTYHRAHSVADAAALLTELGEDAKLIAGGQSLVAMMNFRLARPAYLVDIGGLTGLRYLERDQDRLRIGALTTHHQVEIDSGTALSGGFGILRDTMPWIGHLPIRTRGTVGGSIAHADATAEWCLLAILLDANIVAESVRGRRAIPAAEFFFGFYTTALEPDELIVELEFPHAASHAAVTEYAQRHGDFAVLAVAADLDMADAAVTGGRLVVAGLGPVPVRVPAAEAVLTAGSPMTPELARECAESAVAALEFDNDAPGGAEYLRGLVRTLVPRALTAAVKETR
ncbi:xanthine dehydrogenase family protein subunit M [Nocardia sp. SYP-A9097]|uniref:FAD binding domain-containing protein n=1 Tax=Nocardia sp. SYP-A9097 TaxID=2663237 RepID=UPI00129B1A08|nr:FAD binding domain-containing protein [Nocardia sp. SYP-A9097]MRH87928.1 xanthine dehydrogenase family protein subunit M [Nocardia sp. SYP-A9097]